MLEHIQKALDSARNRAKAYAELCTESIAKIEEYNELKTIRVLTRDEKNALSFELKMKAEYSKTNREYVSLIVTLEKAFKIADKTAL